MSFLVGKASRLGSIEKKHNINNNRYQIIGVYLIVYVGKLVVDSHILIKSQVSPDLTCTKYFPSNIFFRNLNLYSTVKKIYDGISYGHTVGEIDYTGGLVCTIFLVILYMHEVNGRTAHPMYHDLYL